MRGSSIIHLSSVQVTGEADQLTNGRGSMKMSAVAEVGQICVVREMEQMILRWSMESSTMSILVGQEQKERMKMCNLVEQEQMIQRWRMESSMKSVCL